MTLEERITRLEDIEAIKQLKAKYCRACDDNHNPEKISELFADDGIWHGGHIKAEGKSDIKNTFKAIGQAIGFSQHSVTNPIIEVNGNRATGEWYLLELITFRQTGVTKMVSVRYEEEYVKINGVWLYQYLTGTPGIMTSVNTLPWDLSS